MATNLQGFKITRFEFPRGRHIGDSQVSVPDVNWVAAVELFDTAGQSGLGFVTALFDPLPPAAFLDDYFRNAVWPALSGQVPEALLNRVVRPRGGNVRSPSWNLAEGVECALWDLAARHLQLPLFRLLGGTRSRVPAYASGLCFHLSEQQVHDFYTAARRAGYRAYKIKVGHPDLAWDLRRLRVVADAAGPEALLMVDANEAWPVSEAARRLRAYADAGFAIHWVEDPILRSDFGGLRELRQLGAVRVNAGEYLGTEDRLALLAARGVDVMNLNGCIGDALRVARACASAGIPVTVGNTMMNVGAHLAAALPEVDMVEDSQLDWNAILARPIPVVDGCYELPAEPGHGLALSADALRDWKTP